MLKQVLEFLKSDPDIVYVEKMSRQGCLCFAMIISGATYDFHLYLDDMFPASLPVVLHRNFGKQHPHSFEIRGGSLLCLADSDHLLLHHFTVENTLSYTLSQIRKLFSLSSRQLEVEYQREFLFFFEKVATKDSEILLYVKPSTEVLKLEKWVFNKRVLVKNPEIKLTKFHKEAGTCSTAIYIPLDTSSGVLPPGCGVAVWDVKYIRELIRDNVTYENFRKLQRIKLKSRQVLIVFKMTLDHGFEIMFCIEVRFKKNAKGYFWDKLVGEGDDVVLIKSTRCDSTYLQQRIGSKFDYSGKRILLIGCGSLGSYIAQELPKIGIKKLTIVDDDVLAPGNIGRHSLGMSLVGLNKGEAMKCQLDANFPESMIRYVKGKFPCVISDGKIDISEYDLLIIATGGTDKQWKFNSFLKDIGNAPPTLYAWIEGNGLFVHALLVNYNMRGCFKCLLIDDQGQYAMANKAHLVSNEEKNVFSGDGCGGTFTPYGNSVLLKGSSLIIDIVSQMFSASTTFKKNPLFTLSTIPQLQISEDNRYNSMKIRVDYIAEGCDVCGRRISSIDTLPTTK